MIFTRPLALILIAVLAQLSAGGCATPHRLAAVPEASLENASTGLGPIRFLASRDSAAFAAEARNSLAKEVAWRSANGLRGELPTAYFLAISGGGDNGAFGAGFLSGWTASATRPEFKVVTGISTGALIAPFAFLGPRYDLALERVYTSLSPGMVFKSRGLLRGVLSDGMADSRPLARVIALYADRALLDAIAAEYAKGRVLLVGTVNIDALEPVIWNMTAIAANRDPRSISLFRSVLLASASVPGAFPPVMIRVDVNGIQHEEMHVDGGTMTQVFVYPPSVTTAQLRSPPRKRVLYVIRNARFDPEWESVPRKTAAIAKRALGSLTNAQGMGDLYRIFATTRRDGVEFNLAYIPGDFKARHREQFENAYMRKLFESGRALAKGGYEWKRFPPGYEDAGDARRGGR